MGGPLTAKWTICGSHTWSGGPSMATKIAINDPGGPSMAGDHLRHDSTHDVGRELYRSYLLLQLEQHKLLVHTTSCTVLLFLFAGHALTKKGNSRVNKKKEGLKTTVSYCIQAYVGT